MSLYSPREAAYLAQIEAYLSAVLPTGDGVIERAMHYACEGGGKRIRPVLVLSFCELCGGNAAEALPFAAALELIHSYSLVHDDLPCMDNSPLRRGKPSVHAAFGETMALLAGDALLNRAFEVALSDCTAIPAERALRAAHELADLAGVNGMIGGQVLDLESECKAIDLATLQRLQDGKTAALLRAACRMGAIIGGGSEEQRIAADRYGHGLGSCFQIVDDILDVTSTAEELGKPVGSDSENEKTTYVSLLGIDEARRRAEAYTREAIDALSAFPQGTEDLIQLAEALLERRS